MPNRLISCYYRKRNAKYARKYKEKSQDGQTIARANGWTIGSTVVAAFATVVIAGSTAWSVVVISRQLDQMKQSGIQADRLITANESLAETTRIANRAFVNFGRIEIVPNPPRVWGVSIVTVNAGNTTARALNLRFDCPPRQRNPASDQDPFTLSKWRGAGVAPPRFLGPRAAAKLQACNIPVKEYEAAQNRKIDLFIVAEARYLDAFGEERITQMTRQIHFDSDMKRSIGFAGEHNCTDDHCPDQAKRSRAQPP